MHKLSRNNNFDLIRLLAALQVVFWHGCAHFEGLFDYFYNFLRVIYSLPGVPIFFTISGFLIYHSFENNKTNLKKYLRNRFLRIYPALWCCIALTIFLLVISSDIPSSYYFSSSFFIWLAAQLTFFQFYATDVLKSWGVGHPNGSLWTITVEIQFYLLLPILAFLFDRFLTKRLHKNIFYGIILISCFGLKYLFFAEFDTVNSVVKSLYGVTILSHLHHFCIGILIYINFDVLKRHLENKALWWLIGYVGFVLLFKEYLNWYDSVYETTTISLVSNIILSMLTISCAFTLPNLSEKIMRGNDLSYGIYIFHMPVFNYFLATGVLVTAPVFMGIILLIIGIGFLSWRLIERPALQLKTKRSI